VFAAVNAFEAHGTSILVMLDTLEAAFDLLSLA
jgi:hypothetical protein